MITYDYYRIFYYVAQYKSFTKAARALHNNQPNITRCMNNLEQELKCTLFLRSNKGIALTPEGRQLYEHVALAFEQLSIGEEEIRQNGGFRYCHHSDLHPQTFTEKKSPALPGDPCMRKQI